MTGEEGLADHSSELITHSPHPSRAEFLAQVDGLIVELEQAHARVSGPHPGAMD